MQHLTTQCDNIASREGLTLSGSHSSLLRSIALCGQSAFSFVSDTWRASTLGNSYTAKSRLTDRHAIGANERPASVTQSVGSATAQAGILGRGLWSRVEPN